jgi:hypothetical protein
VTADIIPRTRSAESEKLHQELIKSEGGSSLSSQPPVDLRGENRRKSLFLFPYYVMYYLYLKTTLLHYSSIRDKGGRGGSITTW